MKSVAPAALAALEAGDVMVGAAVAILADPAFRVWTGHGDLEIDGETFVGIGHYGLVTTTGGSIGGAAEGSELLLSGVDPEALDLVDVSAYRRAPVIIWRLIFNSAGTTLLGANIHRRGRLDQLPREDTAGGMASIKAMVEGAARGAGRGLVRQRTDSDQRLAEGTDGAFKHVSFAGEKKLNLGGERPASASGRSGSPGASWNRLADQQGGNRGVF